MKITKEQYNTLLQKGLTKEEISTLASERGYNLPSNKSGLEKVTNVVTKVFPGKKIGETFGTAIATGIAAKKYGREAALEVASTAPKPGQVIGDVALGALNIAGLKGVGTVGSLGARIGKSVALGSGMAGAQTISEGGTPKQFVGSLVGGGIIGGALPLAGAGLSGLSKTIKGLPPRLINSALGRTKQQVLQDIAKDKVDDLSKYVLKNKPIGTANKLLRESRDELIKFENKIDNVLSKSKVIIKASNVLDDVSKSPIAEGAMLDKNGVKKVIEKLAPQTKKLLLKETLTHKEANQLRKLLDKTLGDRAFLGGQLNSDREILYEFANKLRNAVQSKAEIAIPGSKQLFTDYANEVRFNRGLLGKVAQKQGNQVLNFGDFIGGGLGGIYGGGIGGAVAGVGTRRALESTLFKTGMAQGANKMSIILEKYAPTIKKLAPAERTFIFNMFSELFSPDESISE